MMHWILISYEGEIVPNEETIQHPVQPKGMWVLNKYFSMIHNLSSNTVQARSFPSGYQKNCYSLTALYYPCTYLKIIIKVLLY